MGINGMRSYWQSDKVAGTICNVLQLSIGGRMEEQGELFEMNEFQSSMHEIARNSTAPSFTWPLFCGPNTVVSHERFSGPKICSPVYSSPPKPVRIKNVAAYDSLKCVVCGDKPSGYHYDVLSCTGCKTFFRRAVVAGRFFICSKGGNCAFDKHFRCLCRACRFNKCISSGMNVTAIRKRYGTSSSLDSLEWDVLMPSTSAATSRQHYNRPQPLLRQLDPPDGLLRVNGMLTDLLRREVIANELREKWTVYADVRLDDILLEPCLLGVGHRKGLQQWQGALEEQFAQNPIRYWTVVDLILTVEYAKSFAVFRELSHVDQRTLLSHIGGVMAILGQAFYSAKMKQCTTVFPDGTVAMKSIDSGRCSNVMKNETNNWVCQLFNLPVASLRDIDAHIFPLLKAVAFFSPMDDLLSEEAKKRLQQERENHMGALGRLLLVKEGGNGASAGPSKMAEIVTTLQMMYRLNEKKRSSLLLYDAAKKLDLSILGREIQLREHM